MLTYINFKFNSLIKYHSFILIVEEYECSHQDVSQAIYNIRIRVVSYTAISIKVVPRAKRKSRIRARKAAGNR